MNGYNGNNAYRIKIKEREEERLQRRDNPRYESFVKAKKKKIIGTILLLMAVALVGVLRYARISVLNNELQTAKKELSDAVAEKTNLEIERDRIIDLANVENIAVNEYGMSAPTKDQIVYITVSRKDSVKLENRSFLEKLFRKTSESYT